jgi:hypothetical protein
MIVIVETNFLLELVLQQEQFGACQELLSICAAEDDLQLVVPAFAVAEAGMKLERRQGERLRFVKEGVSPQITESERSEILSRYRAILDELRNALILADQDENNRWIELQLLLHDHVVPLTSDILGHAISTQIGLNLKLPDAIVITSVRRYLDTRATSAVPAIFVSTDERGFRKPEALAYLRELNCKYISSFENAVQYLRHRSP